MKCPRCGASLELTAMSCAGCGASTDADRDGVPDQLNTFIEQKARQLLAEQKRQEAAEAESAKRAEAEASAAADRERARRQLEEALGTARAEVARAKVAVAANAAKKRPRVAHVLLMFWVAFLLALVLGLGAMGCEGCIDQSISGRLFCDRACPTCHGPGHVFSSHNSINNSTEWVQLCHNHQVDIHEAFGGGWRQYQLSMWWGYPVYVLVFWFGGAAVLPFLAGRITRDALQGERARLLRRMENSEALLSEHERRDGHQPYR